MNVESCLLQTHGRMPLFQRRSAQLAQSLLNEKEEPHFAALVQIRMGAETFPAVLVISSERLLIACCKMAFSRYYSIPLDAITGLQEFNAINYRLKITTRKTRLDVQMNKAEGEKLAEQVSKLLNETFDYSKADQNNRLFSDAYIHQKARLKARAQKAGR